MTRAQFLGLFTLPFLTKFVKEEEPKCVFNEEKLKARLEYLNQHPSEIRKYPLTEHECFPYKHMGIFIPEGTPIEKGGGRLKLFDVEANVTRDCKLEWVNEDKTYIKIKYKP